jgi:hypothetical protein
VRTNFHKALDLSAAYRDSSPASRALWKRLIAMRKTLMKQDNLSSNEGFIVEGTNNGSTNNGNSNGAVARHNNSNYSSSGSAVDIIGRASVSNGSMAFGNMGNRDGETDKTTNAQPISNMGYVQDDMAFIDLTRFGASDTETSAECLEFSRTDLLGNQGLADGFTIDWPTCDMRTFFSESGL